MLPLVSADTNSAYGEALPVAILAAKPSNFGIAAATAPPFFWNGEHRRRSANRCELVQRKAGLISEAYSRIPKETGPLLK